MKSELRITFRNIEPSEEVEKWIRSKAARLDGLYGQVMGCHVVVELPHRHHRDGKTYHVRIDINVPQGKLVVGREPSLSARTRQLGQRGVTKRQEVRIPHRDLRQAINDAFKAAGRRLQDYARCQRGDVKHWKGLPAARVSQIFPGEGYGFLASADGRQIYFHKNSVLGRAFPRLKIGATVRFAEEQGEKGPQASTIHVVPPQGAPEAVEENVA